MQFHLHDGLLFIWCLTAAANVVARKPSNITELIPSPLVVPASQYWDGVDGLWSSFALRIGTPAQDVRVLASTNSPETLVVLPLGCTSLAINPVPNGCASSRGGLFNPNISSTWQDQGLFGINGDGVGFEENLGYSQAADYGLDTLGLGFVAGGANNPTLRNQTVAGIATATPFYLGILGLNTQPVNYSTIGNFSAPSLFTTLRSQQLIPSLSWSFTAGAKYRSKAGQNAQLIFGGYDSSRFVPNSASFTLNQDIDRDIVIAIQSITYSGTTQSTLLSTPTFAFIESTDPNIWLPDSACKAFEQAFGITTDKATGLYLLNATQYTQLQAKNPQVTFILSNSLSGGETVSIVLPFNALALPASPPFTPNNTYYFPLKKAANDSQNTLGRVFLQEAYLTVDYERGNFSVSQCVWQDGAPERISAILSPEYANSSSTTTSSTSASKPVGAGIIAAVVIAVIAVLALAAGLGYFVSQRRQRDRPTSTSPTEDIGLTNLDKNNNYIKTESLPDDPNSLYPPYKKFDYPSGVHREQQPDSELGTHGEIYQMPTTEHGEGNYFTALNRIESERRAATTPQIDGRSMVYELHGSEPMPAEMDDEGSRRGLSPMLSPRTPITRGSSRASSLGPVSDAF
ncbi:aspartic peptidase domain-containing protein [Hyaloscypha sp. PMI_1271]|nr:aspartic peptidase domain-containing protein [Hyaloscypha sp. PMI_1271]